MPLVKEKQKGGLLKDKGINRFKDDKDASTSRKKQVSFSKRERNAFLLMAQEKALFNEKRKVWFSSKETNKPSL